MDEIEEKVIDTTIEEAPDVIEVVAKKGFNFKKAGFIGLGLALAGATAVGIFHFIEKKNGKLHVVKEKENPEETVEAEIVDDPKEESKKK